MKMTTSDSDGSIQKIVEASPPHMNSPVDPAVCVSVGPRPTATVSPKPVPSNPTSPYPPGSAKSRS